MEPKRQESGSEGVELRVGVKTSKPKMSLELSSRVCDDGEAYACRNGLFDSPLSLGLSPRTAAAQTQTPSTKPKARTLVACRQLIDGSEAPELRDQSPPPLLTFKGTVTSESADPDPDPDRTSSVHTFITERSSGSADQRDEAPRPDRNVREESKSQYYRELCLQVEERKQQMRRERRRNAADELMHIETMQRSVCGLPGSGAPNSHLGTVRRTRSLHSAGILPQEQIRDKGFSGTPFRRP